jgi:Tfp pilus assembly protein PilF/TolB-like protein
LKRADGLVVMVSLLLGLSLHSQEIPASGRTPAGRAAFGRTVVIIPFENLSAAPGLEWLGESFPETFHEQLNSPILYVASRGERLRAYDRQGIPAGIHPARATLYRLAEQMDVDYAVFGSYRYTEDGNNDHAARLTATAQLLDMRAQKLFPAVRESAPPADLGALQSALAWDLLRLIRTDFSVPKDKYVASAAPMRVDAMENYILGITASSGEEKVHNYREATRLDSAFARAWLELGKTYYEQHTYDLAITALEQVPHSSPLSREANFYLGLAAYSRGDFAKSESAFEFVANRVPLAEVYNDLGVVAARRGQKKAAEYFARAIQNDPSDADYHFNLGVALLQAGDRAGAARELHTALDHRSNDGEARTLLDLLSSPAGGLVPASATVKMPSERIKRNYEEDAFRQVNSQMSSWAEQRFSRSDARTHARFHVELGKELLAHGFTSEAAAEFHHASIIDPSSSSPLIGLAEDYDARGDVVQARAEVEAALRLRESAEAYLLLARLDLKENKTEAATRNINRALQLEPANSAGQNLKHTLAAKLAEKAQPLSQP